MLKMVENSIVEIIGVDMSRATLQTDIEVQLSVDCHPNRFKNFGCDKIPTNIESARLDLWDRF